MLFRFRRAMLFLIFALGFWAPWERLAGNRPGTTWLFLAGVLARYGLLPIAYASIAVMGAAIVAALLGAILRTWAAAYLGTGVVWSSELHGERIVASGPYRYFRNPLYAGLWLNTLAVAILMPPGGAIFAVVAVAALSLALTGAEERRLRVEGGEAYAEYARRVPRFFPALRPRIAKRNDKPHWRSGFLGEFYFWGVAVTYIAFGNRYNATILEQGILISLGLSIVLRAVLRPALPATHPRG